VKPEGDDEYDVSGYDLSRYESDEESLRLAGSDDPDAVEEADDGADSDDDDEPVGAGTGARRRSRRGGARRRTRP
jgi:ribonuclease E